MPMSASQLVLRLDNDFQYGILCVISAESAQSSGFLTIAHPALKEYRVLSCGVERGKEGMLKEVGKAHTKHRGRKLRQVGEWTPGRYL